MCVTITGKLIRIDAVGTAGDALEAGLVMAAA